MCHTGAFTRNHALKFDNILFIIHNVILLFFVIFVLYVRENIFKEITTKKTAYIELPVFETLKYTFIQPHAEP